MVRIRQRLVAHYRKSIGSGETKPLEGRIVRSPTKAKEMGMQTAHMEALQARHAGLEARILEENLRPHPDESVLARLKKEKWKLKDEMTGH
jgi:hypothetical protein